MGGQPWKRGPGVSRPPEEPAQAGAADAHRTRPGPGRTRCAACCGRVTSVLLVAEPGGFQVQAALQLLAGGLAYGAVVVEAGKFGVLGGIEVAA